MSFTKYYAEDDPIEISDVFLRVLNAIDRRRNFYRRPPRGPVIDLLATQLRLERCECRVAESLVAELVRRLDDFVRVRTPEAFDPPGGRIAEAAVTEIPVGLLIAAVHQLGLQSRRFEPVATTSGVEPALRRLLTTHLTDKTNRMLTRWEKQGYLSRRRRAS